MIYTVTCNPALDYVVKLDALKLGEVNRTREEALYYGGKELMYPLCSGVWAWTAWLWDLWRALPERQSKRRKQSGNPY